VVFYFFSLCFVERVGYNIMVRGVKGQEAQGSRPKAKGQTAKELLAISLFKWVAFDVIGYQFPDSGCQVLYF
jgi:hypothetical protein